MPVPCSKCGEWVELNSTRESEFNKGKMLCPECYSTEDSVKDKIEEIRIFSSCLTIMTRKSKEIVGDGNAISMN